MFLQTAQDNIDLQTTILSRFDLIFIVKDIRMYSQDKVGNFDCSAFTMWDFLLSPLNVKHDVKFVYFLCVVVLTFKPAHHLV